MNRIQSCTRLILSAGVLLSALSLTPAFATDPLDRVVAVVDDDFTVKYLHLRAGRVRLKAANPTFPDIVPKDGQTIEVWGVVTTGIKRFMA